MGKVQKELLLFTRATTYISSHHLWHRFLPLSVLEHAMGTISFKGRYSVKIMMLTQQEYTILFFFTGQL